MAIQHIELTEKLRISNPKINANFAYLKDRQDQHEASAAAHRAEHIPYSGEIEGADNTKEALDNLQTQLSLAIVEGDSGPAAEASRYNPYTGITHASLPARLNTEWQENATQLAEKAQKNATFANAQDSLKIINYLGNIDNVHPKVLYFANLLFGWRYWMAYTPYPAGDTNHENPCLAVSRDGINWTAPQGVTNPVAEPPVTGGYNSDTHLVYRSDTNTLEVWWRTVNVSGSTITSTEFYRRVSTDGVSWSAPQKTFDMLTYGSDLVSPAILYEAGKYKLWGVKGRRIWYNESTDGVTWNSADEVVTDIDWGPLAAWHLDVIRTAKGYEFVVQAYPTVGGSNNDSDLYYVVSTDNLTFSKPRLIIAKSENPNAFDNRGIYRSSIVMVGNLYYIYYSAVARNTRRAIALSVGSDILALMGYVGNNDLDLLKYRPDTDGYKLPRVTLLSTGHYDYGAKLSASGTIDYTAQIRGNKRPDLSGGLQIGYLYVDDANTVASQSLPVIAGAIRREGDILYLYTGTQWIRINDSRQPVIITGGQTLTDFDLTHVMALILRGSGTVTINSFIGGTFFDETKIIIDSTSISCVINDTGLIVTPGRTTYTLDQTNVACTVSHMASNRWRVY